MAYHKNNATGHAGEHFFAYSIIENLNWPCRLLDIDIGIDAQVEIIDSDGFSKNKYFAAQVKSTKKKINLYVLEVERHHLEYWKGEKVPVIIFICDLTKKSIYFKDVSKIIMKENANTASLKIDEFELLKWETAAKVLNDIAGGIVEKKFEEALENISRINNFLPEIFDIGNIEDLTPLDVDEAIQYRLCLKSVDTINEYTDAVEKEMQKRAKVALDRFRLVEEALFEVAKINRGSGRFSEVWQFVDSQSKW